MTTFYSWIARMTYRFKWWLLGVWIVVFAVAAIGATAAEHVLKVGGFSLPGTEFHTASQVLSDDLDLSSDKAALVVFHSDELLVTERGTPIARVLPPESDEAHIARLIRQGTITPARRPKQPIDVSKLPTLPPGPRLSDIVVAMRRGVEF